MAIEELSNSGQPKPPEIGVVISEQNPKELTQAQEPFFQGPPNWGVDGIFGSGLPESQRDSFFAPDLVPPIRAPYEIDIYANPEQKKDETVVFNADPKTQTFG